MSWLRRLFASSRQKALDAVMAEVADLGPAPPPGALLPESPAAPPEAWAAALGVGAPALDDATPPPTSPEASTAEAVLAHFEAHRPGPASFPSIALRVLELVRDPKVDSGALARTVEMDTALSGAVVVLANSAVFRGVSKVETLREAVTRLGMGELARLVAALSARSLYRSVRAEFELFGPTWNQLFYHALIVARASAELGRARRLGDPDRAFLGGMLHDVGKSLALRSLAALVLEGRVPRHDPAAVERILHQVHVVIGAEAHREWGLPPGLAAIAEWHHLPEIAAGPRQFELHLVRLASAVELIRTSPGVSSTAPAEAVGSARALGLGPARVLALRTSLGEHADWVRMLFGDETGGPAAGR